MSKAPQPHRRSARRSAACTAAIIAFFLSALASFPEVAAAQEVTPELTRVSVRVSQKDGRSYLVGDFQIEYRDPHPDHPSLGSILPHVVRLTTTPTGYVSPRPGEQTESVTLSENPAAPVRFHASALATISRSLLKQVHSLGLMGVYVRPSPLDIDPKTEADQRGEANLTLRYSVWSGRIQEVRTIAVGDRIKDSWVVDNSIHSEIREDSPLQPLSLGDETTTDLLKSDVLEDYLFRLNRHPGRYVEAALAASEDGEGIALDYRVHEQRPWTPYLQSSNTGTKRTHRWQTRLGFTHRQVSQRDDIFNIEFLNAGIDELNGLRASYEAPWFNNRRPKWMKTSGYESKWLKWFDRDKIPWWGSDRLRWKINGGWSRVEIGIGQELAAENNRATTKEWSLGGRITHETWQHRNLFIDTYLGGQFRHLDVDNDTSNTIGDLAIKSGEFGFTAERLNAYSALYSGISVEVGSIDGNQTDFIAASRKATDDFWTAIRWNVGWSHFIEPLIDRSAWEDPSSEQSSTLAHEVALGFRGQYAFDYRLIPQVSELIGGVRSIRGFAQGVAAGDSVYIATAEYRFHLPRALPVDRVPLQIPWIGDFRVSPQQVYGRPDWDLIMRGFFDIGYAVRNGDFAPEFNSFLVSAGVGLEATFRGNARIRFDWARGIHESHSNPNGKGKIPIDQSGKFHLLFSISY